MYIFPIVSVISEWKGLLHLEFMYMYETGASGKCNQSVNLTVYLCLFLYVVKERIVL